jgi:hypothetical protein
VAARGDLVARFAHQFPLEQGGALFVLGGTHSAAVNEAVERFGLAEVRTLECDADVAVFVPGVDARATKTLEVILLEAPGARVKERAVVPPRGALR